MHVTKAVFSESSSLISDAKSLGFSLVFGIHHLTVKPEFWAMETHGAMFASWSILEMMISDPGGKANAIDRLRNSWVVEDPKTIQLLAMPRYLEAR